ncbi:ABC transporter ATP-binding protein [uncultured Eudoraea sp.]|jgi:ABC-2 type transport system ATP-binding protein|uniref:ABC transporter ATP-binding protein n=1 Tax=uncultured Eudoraea sp. TaxID=1035614 RepID=UPI002612EFE0|nr:ABC transporter ATP-binding protein [uncultured Eudoraea sp.]
MILEARNIFKSYGSIKVLKNVTIECHRGKIYGLIGANGAGKTTLFRILLGLIKQDSGSIEINSQGIKPIGGIVEKPALYGYLSAFGNLKVFAQIQGLKLTKDLFCQSMEQVGLSPTRKDVIRNYSLGMKQRLGLAIALLNNPECIVLDEPFSGLDPMGIFALHELIKKLSSENHITVIISSHIVSELTDLCDTLYVLNEGEIIKSGSTAQLIKENVTTFKISGKNLEMSEVLKDVSAVFLNKSALVSPKSMSISEVLHKLMKEGIEITACIPQTDLKALFGREPV